MNIVPIQQQTVDPEISFDSFWACYPRRVAKAAARKAWARLSPDQQAAAIIGIVAWRPIMLTKDAEYLPHPASWLNGERWEDELPSKVSAASHVAFKESAPLPPKGVLPDHVLAQLKRLTGRQS